MTVNTRTYGISPGEKFPGGITVSNSTGTPTNQIEVLVQRSGALTTAKVIEALEQIKAYLQQNPGDIA